MVTSQNTCGSSKRPAADDNKVSKKPTKKMAPKKASFAPKPQTPVSSQDVNQLSFVTSADRSLSVVTPKPRSPISPQQRQKTAFSNHRPPINKTWETFGDQISTDYLSSANNMAEYKNGYRYFHARLSLIARGFSIDELKNISNATFPQFLEDDKE
ncbi:hypothetical protein MMC31_003294 [Peltigera leucophlebia]|nr:hypothetical protein [Peltigera leucophlebia]